MMMMMICPIVNVIARREFELVYYAVTVQHVSHASLGEGGVVLK